MVRKFLAFIGLTVFLGMVVLTGLSNLSTRFASWDYIGKVPATPTELFYEGYNPIRVRTSNDEIFACSMETQTCTLDKDYQSLARLSYLTDSLTPFPPGTVVTSFVAMESFGDTVLERHFIALDDGRIWTWRRDPFKNSSLNLHICGTIGLIILAGTVVFLFSMPSRSRPQQKVKNDAKHASNL